MPGGRPAHSTANGGVASVVLSERSGGNEAGTRRTTATSSCNNLFRLDSLSSLFDAGSGPFFSLLSSSTPLNRAHRRSLRLLGARPRVYAYDRRDSSRLNTSLGTEAACNADDFLKVSRPLYRVRSSLLIPRRRRSMRDEHRGIRDRLGATKRWMEDRDLFSCVEGREEGDTERPRFVSLCVSMTIH